MSAHNHPYVKLLTLITNAFEEKQNGPHPANVVAAEIALDAIWPEIEKIRSEAFAEGYGEGIVYADNSRPE